MQPRRAAGDRQVHFQVESRRLMSMVVLGCIGLGVRGLCIRMHGRNRSVPCRKISVNVCGKHVSWDRWGVVLVGCLMVAALWRWNLGVGRRDEGRGMGTKARETIQHQLPYITFACECEQGVLKFGPLDTPLIETTSNRYVRTTLRGKPSTLIHSIADH
ncbi:hypothetical protein T440DRAFT_214611 [Plenodomus tracheiphilus IPT5]|uniref:Uncharacterized protein n=1 Tax=Plenodomus tracheiphilus IPT5 TaxID=1408161 RepID=A0A6A7AWM6_9PLEO|nr:hypothetical protein T440DRAFT_214611 [Plenodomus tracheiphilus IPT5]